MHKIKISPEYPRVSLPKVVEKLKSAEENLRIDHTNNFVKEEQIARILGYKGISGASIALLASLKKFGFLEEDVNRKNFRLSPAAKKIIESPKSMEESFKVLEEAAFHYELYNELKERFGFKFPNIEEIIEFLLERYFMPKALPRVIISYYETVRYLSEFSKKYEAPFFLDNEAIEYAVAQKHINLLDVSANSKSNFSTVGSRTTPPLEIDRKDEKTFNFQIPGDFEATVIIRGNVNEDSIERLISFLEISKKSFSRK